MEWEKTYAGNEVLQGEGFYVSYQGDADGLNNPMLAMANTLGSIIGGLKTKKCETALKGPDGVWRILNGDFRIPYEEAFPRGFDACLEVYNAHKPEFRSDWSTDEEAANVQQL